MRDMQQNKVWTFLVQHWLSLTHERSGLIHVVLPATVEELYQWRLLFIEHLKLGFQEQHMWSNIFLR